MEVEDKSFMVTEGNKEFDFVICGGSHSARPMLVESEETEEGKEMKNRTQKIIRAAVVIAGSLIALGLGLMAIITSM